MKNEWDFPGSRWWKIDFHTHTPKSDDYGQGDKNIITNTTPEIWLQKCMEAKIDCVVMTDHNSGEWIDDLKRKYDELNAEEPKKDWFESLHIFPGVEITVSLGRERVHLIAVFDPKKDGNNITAALGKCGITAGFGNPNTSSQTSFEDIVDIINESGGIAIPAHIDGPQGLLNNVETLKPELKRSLRKIYSAEFCDIHAFDDCEVGLKEEVERLAKVGGSDAHKPDDIGRHNTWVKMSNPSINGLKLALHDHEYCVKNQREDPNNEPDEFIRSLEIKNMYHCGRIDDQPFKINFNPHFNALIGGRGTGKSTVLESIRITTRRMNQLKEFEKLNSKMNEFTQKYSNNKTERGVMLDDSELILHFHRRGIEYKLHWRYDGEGVILEEKNAEGWIKSTDEITAGTIRNRFPISIYSQKQINELASNPKGLLEIVDRSSDVNKKEWESDWKSLKGEFSQLRQRRRQIIDQLNREIEIKAKLKDVENDLSRYNSDVLIDYQKRSQQIHAMSLDDNFGNLADELKNIAENISFADFPSHVFNDDDPTIDEIQTIHKETKIELENIRKFINEIAGKVGNISTERKQKLEASKWYNIVNDAINAYNDLVDENREMETPLDLNLYTQWVQQRSQLQKEMGKIRSLKEELEETDKDIERLKTAILSLRKELLEKRSSFIDEIIGDNPHVRMEVVQFGEVSEIETDFRKIFNLDNSRFESSILDYNERTGLLWDLLNWRENDIDENELPTLIDTIKNTIQKMITGDEEDKPEYIHGSFVNRLKEDVKNNPEFIDRLLLWWPEDLLKVKFTRESTSSEFTELKKGSDGQKATAILAFLLSYGDEPLIMDQPEDDLDNKMIYQMVVNQIHKNKDHRQLIIVTHNPNIVVNGDAELVHILHFKHGQIQLLDNGGLEEESIRKHICEIMEGGAEAFEKRYRRMKLEVL